VSDRPTGADLIAALEAGEVRACEPGPDGTWRVNAWVKEGILDVFRSSEVVRLGEDPLWPFTDKAAFDVRGFEPERGVRLVPGGSSVRRGAYVADGVVMMPPMYVNVGAWIGPGSMIDSHALVGSCAQVGAGVHVSAATQLGGVLEPAGARPVIVEDEVLVGGNAGLYDGVLVRRGAVIGAGVVLTASTPVFDLVNERVLRASAGAPLEIPAGAVVVPGTRPATGNWAGEQGLATACALIPKYRDERTDRATALEQALR
jgi:2,3,4,5-tetrahydropyridine-2-carboxylate N-succinyltransferase